MDIEYENGLLQLMSITENETIDWENIFKSLNNALLFCNELSLERIRPILLVALLRCGTDDFSTVKRIVKTCALGMGWDSICKRHRRIIFSDIVFNRSSKIHKMCSFPGLRLLDMAVQAGDVRFTSVLVKYGLFQVYPDTNIIHHNISVAEAALADFCCDSNFFGLSLQVDMEMCHHTSKSLLRQLRESKGNVIFRRIQLILRILGVISLKRLGYPTLDSVKCIRMFFSTITDTFVTKEEVNLFLRYVFRYESTHTIADILSEDFVSLFSPEALELYKPRSLLHLCRYSIRRALIEKGGVLPKQVDDLFIPGSLKSYILVECDM